MRVARIHDLGDVRVEAQPLPELKPGDALVRMAVCGICTSDTLPWYVRRKTPAVLGHEPTGTIVKTDSDLFSVGDRLFIHHHAPCMTCRHCQRSEYSLCTTWRASAIDPGGLAEFVRVPAHNLQHDCFRLPDEMSFEDGALIEPVACAVQALKRRSRMQAGDRVLILGAGMMGQILIRVARHYGASTLIAADREPYRLRKASKAGANVAVDVSSTDLAAAVRNATEGDGADLVVVCPGSIAAMTSGLECVAPGGTVCLFTPAEAHEALPVSPHDLWFNHVTLTTSYSCGPPDTREAADLIGKGAVTADQIVTHRFSLDQAGEGFDTVSEAGESIKTLIIIDPDQARTV
tara:strand:- start:27529 stop:28572 length:1044 start_codon:yes stop_codon:yes gene_type:complete